MEVQHLSTRLLVVSACRLGQSTGTSGIAITSARVYNYAIPRPNLAKESTCFDEGSCGRYLVVGWPVPASSSPAGTIDRHGAVPSVPSSPIKLNSDTYYLLVSGLCRYLRYPAARAGGTGLHSACIACPKYGWGTLYGMCKSGVTLALHGMMQCSAECACGCQCRLVLGVCAVHTAVGGGPPVRSGACS